MATSESTARRWWLGASALAVFLTLVLAAGGVSLALRQGRAVEQARIRGLRDRAEIASNRLQAQLRRLADSRLTRVHEAYRNRNDLALNQLVSADEWIELAFVYDRWALITWPATTVARSDRSHEAFAPPGFGLAEGLEFVDGKLEEAIALYRQCTGEATPVYWQLQAQMAIAACRGKQGRFDEAIEIYRRLLTRYATVLRGMDSPSLFEVHLALVDTLVDANNGSEASHAAEVLLRGIRAGQIPLPAREYADLLVHRLDMMGDRFPGEIHQTRRELVAIAERQHDLAGAASVVRTWMEPRLDPPLGTEERGVQFVTDTLGARPRALAYRRFYRGGVETLVGICIYLPALHETFVVPTVRTAGGDDLTVGPRDAASPEEEGPWMQALAMPLHKWQLRPAATFSDRVKREVSRQTVIYIILTSVAVAVLITALVVLALAVRRETALTRLKNEFVANVSHELKTPLALIRLFGETLLYGRAVDDDKRREYYAVITRESERLTHLINNILDFSRIDAGHKRYQRTECDVGDVVGRTLESYRFQLDHHGFECHVEIEPDLPPARADADAISQAVLNLLNNAVKYSWDEKSIEVRVKRARRGGREGMTIAVADRGVGIPEDEQHRLFDGFFRGSDEAVRATRGSGLGLTLVHHIIAGHDGEIWVDSTPGVGSTFTIFLPDANHQPSGESSCHAS